MMPLPRLSLTRAAKIPLSGAGITYAWNSVQLISMITVGGLLAVVFVLFEWKLAKMPIMPCEMFPSPLLLLQGNFLTPTKRLTSTAVPGAALSVPLRTVSILGRVLLWKLLLQYV